VAELVEVAYHIVQGLYSLEVQHMSADMLRFGDSIVGTVLAEGKLKADLDTSALVVDSDIEGFVEMTVVLAAVLR